MTYKLFLGAVPKNKLSVYVCLFVCLPAFVRCPKGRDRPVSQKETKQTPLRSIETNERDWANQPQPGHAANESECFLAPFHACVCVCVCVCLRERAIVLLWSVLWSEGNDTTMMVMKKEYL